MLRVFILATLACISHAFVMLPAAAPARVSRTALPIMDEKEDFFAPLSNVPAEALWLNIAGVGLVATGAGISATGSPSGGLVTVTLAVVLMKLGAMKLEEGNDN